MACSCSSVRATLVGITILAALSVCLQGCGTVEEKVEKAVAPPQAETAKEEIKAEDEEKKQTKEELEKEATEKEVKKAKDDQTRPSIVAKSIAASQIQQASSSAAIHMVPDVVRLSDKTARLQESYLQGSAGLAQPVVKAAFNAIDQDQDGVISLAEFVSASTG